LQIKIDPVTFGGSCTSWDQCENGTYCDLDWDKPGAPGLCLRKYSLFLNLNA